MYDQIIYLCSYVCVMATGLLCTSMVPEDRLQLSALEIFIRINKQKYTVEKICFLDKLAKPNGHLFC